jgi:hypothetical protein
MSNTVKLKPTGTEKIRYTMEELQEQLRDYAQTAFIGNIGSFRNELFLITYESIVRALNPNITWSYFSEPVIVHKFVNIEIREL